MNDNCYNRIDDYNINLMTAKEAKEYFEDNEADNYLANAEFYDSKFI